MATVPPLSDSPSVSSRRRMPPRRLDAHPAARGPEVTPLDVPALPAGADGTPTVAPVPTGAPNRAPDRFATALGRAPLPALAG
ncbi:hypothetical protein [Streptomyces subrutilus]|uniref:hypothetical protein n=1 Tax=Streptomyces subrutilus TaxID=36818 RepID=UPI002E102DD6|nr:hypothetical protein OG479_28615 [Streptomyces subrutilus]